MGDQKTLENAIISLSRMLRYSLNQEDWTTIKEGFQFLKSYCSLQQLRFEDRLQVYCDYDEMTADYFIPKLILQPFVENAIIHGCEPSPNPCTLTISSKIINAQNESFLELSVVDNGIGFDSEQEFTSKSIGITNVRERLKMLYPSSTLQITSFYQKGTSVTIKIPERDVKK
jgi:two-component system sensor histidine kinase YesM